MLENNAIENKKYVAFLDILGFSDFVNKNAHEDIVNTYKELLYYIEMGLSRGVYPKLQDEKLINVPDVSRFKLNSLIISDSCNLRNNISGLFSNLYFSKNN